MLPPHASYAVEPTTTPGQEGDVGGTVAPHLLEVLKQGGISPAADASRFGGVVKIGGAEEGLHGTLQMGNAAVQSLDGIQKIITNHALVLTVPTYKSTGYFPGLVWSFGNKNEQLPQMGVWGQMTDTGSKMYFGTSNFYRDGITNQALTIDQTGQIGIGTTSPGAKLDVAGNIRSSDGTRGTAIVNDTAGGGRSYLLLDKNVSNGIGVGSDYLYLAQESAQAVLQSASGTPLILGSGSEQMRIAVGGNVGIGTTNPGADLDVGGLKAAGALRTVFARQGEGNTSGEGTFLGVRAWGTQQSSYGGKEFSLENGFYGQTNGAINFYRGGDTRGGFLRFATNIGTEQVAIDAAGAVGIGTMSPSSSSKLHISGGDNSMALFGPNAGWSGYLWVGAGRSRFGAATAQVISTNGNLHLDAGTNNHLYLGFYNPTDTYINPSGGNVGIGTVDRLEKGLTVNTDSDWGNVHLTSKTSNGESAVSFKSADDANGGDGQWLAGKNIYGITDDSFSIANGKGNKVVVDIAGNTSITGTAKATDFCVGDKCVTKGSFSNWTKTGDNLSNSNSGSVTVKSAVDNVLNLQTTDNTWLYTQWLDKDGTRKIWMGLDSGLSWFNIQPENGTKGVILGGNVGIGAAPEYKLDVRGPIATSDYFYRNSSASTWSPVIKSKNEWGVGDTSLMEVGFGAVDGTTRIRAWRRADKISSPENCPGITDPEQCYQSKNNYLDVGQNGIATPGSFSAGQNITAGQSVGTVNGSDWLGMRTNNSENYSEIRWGDDVSTDRLRFVFDHYDGSANDKEVMTLLGSGNVGIGTASPGAKLHISGGGAIVSTNGNNSNTRTLTLLADGQSQINHGPYPGAWTAALQIQNNNNSRLLWMSPLDSASGANARIRSAATGLDVYTGGTTTDNGVLALSMSSSGNVGIGTANPLADRKLHVTGPIRMETGAGAWNWLEVARGSDTIYFGGDETNRGIWSNGTRDVGLYTNGFARLLVKGDTGNIEVGGGYSNGGISLLSDGTLQVGKDINLKGNIYRENLQQLAIKNNTLTLNAGGSPQDAFIKVDRTNGQIKWNNSANQWDVSPKVSIPGGAIDNTAFNGLLRLDVQNSDESPNGAFSEAKPSYGIEFRRKWHDQAPYNVQAGIYAWGSGSWSSGLAFRTSAAGPSLGTRMVITGDGNVGIGTTRPDARLDVNGNIRIPNAGKIVFGSAGEPSDYLELHDRTTGGALLNLIQDGSSKFYIEGASGNVGIGTTGPGAKLDVVGTRYPTVGTDKAVSKVGGDDVFLYTGAINGGNYAMWMQAFRSSDAAVFPLALNPSGGNVGIGTTNPSSKLEVNYGGDGKLCLGDVGHGQGWPGLANCNQMSTTGYALIQEKTGAHTLINKNSAVGYIGFRVANADKMVINQDGNVGIGTTSPGAKLDVNGSVRGGGRTRVEVDRSIGGATDDTVAVGWFSNDGVGKNIKVYLKAHNGGVIDVHTYEINEVAYLGASTNWLEAPINNNSASYSGRAGYALDIYRPNIGSTSDRLYMRVRNKIGVGAGTVQLVIEYDDDISFNELSSRGSVATSFNQDASPAGGAVSGYYGSVEWNFPVSAGDGWENSQGGLIIKNGGNVGIGTVDPKAKLHVSAGDSSLALFGPNAKWNGRLYVGAAETKVDDTTAQVISTDGNLHLDAANGNNIYLGYYNAANTYINPSGGNVGIGTTSPGAKFDVAGDIRVGSSATENTIKFYGLTGDNPNAYDHTVIAERLFNFNGSTSDHAELLLFKGNDIDTCGSPMPHGSCGDRIRLDTPGSIVFQTGNGYRSYNPSVEGNTAMIINSAGNVGIGMTDPSQKFDVNGNTLIRGTLNVNSHIVTPNSLSAGNIVFRGTGGNSGQSYSHYAIYQEPGNWTHPFPDLMIEYHTGIKYVAYSGYGGHRFYAGYSPDAKPTTEVFSIGNGDNNARAKYNLLVDGNVGIGTSEPRSKLEVVGVGRYSSSATGSSLVFDGTGLTANNNYSNIEFLASGDGGSAHLTTKIDNYGGYFNWVRGSNSGDVEVMRINADNGNVGIGTIDPGTYRLNVTGVIASSPGASGMLRIGSGSNGDALLSGSAATGHLTINASNTVGGNIIFQSRSTTTMEIDGSTGNIGIGASPSPSYKLNVAGGDINVSYGTDTKKIASADEKLALATDRIGLDVAELFQTKEDVEVGDVVAVANEDRILTKSSRGYQDTVVGIVSGAPALLFEGSELKLGANPNRFNRGTKPPVALAGRIPVKVSLENGPIKPGDYLTTSSAPGVAMKATQPGMAIGVALESYNGTGNNKILIFLSLGEKNVGSLVKEFQQKEKEMREKLNALDQRMKIFEHKPLW